MVWDDQGMLCGIVGVRLGREEQKGMGKGQEMGKGLLCIQYINKNDLWQNEGYMIGSSGR